MYLIRVEGLGARFSKTRLAQGRLTLRPKDAGYAEFNHRPQALYTYQVQGLSHDPTMIDIRRALHEWGWLKVPTRLYISNGVRCADAGCGAHPRTEMAYV